MKEDEKGGWERGSGEGKRKRGRETLGREGTMQFGGNQLFWVKQRLGPRMLRTKAKGNVQ